MVALTVLAGCTVGARPGGTRSSEENSVSRQVDTTHRFDVDLAGPMPSRAQLGLAPGQTQRTYDGGSTPVQVTYHLTGGRELTVPASSVTVSTTSMDVTNPRHPVADDDLVLPNEVAATQDFDTKDQARQLLLAQADVLGLDPADIARWYATAPEAPGPNVVLDKRYFSGRARIGYVDVSVGVFISDLGYLIWDLSWDPPIPGYTYGTDGVPTPTAS